jgi:hypothetical protein
MNSVIKELRIMGYMMVVVFVAYALSYVMYYHVRVPVVTVEVDVHLATIMYITALFANVIVLVALIDCRRKERAYYDNCRIMRTDVKGGAYYW